MNMIKDVKDFNKKCNFLKLDLADEEVLFEDLSFRHQLLKECADNFENAIISEDIIDIIDSNLDSIYTALCTLHQLGIDIESFWDNIHQANMKDENDKITDHPEYHHFNTFIKSHVSHSIKPNGKLFNGLYKKYFEILNSHYPFENDFYNHIYFFDGHTNRVDYEIEIDNKNKAPTFKKDDDDKPMVGLIPGDVIYEIAKVLTFGAKKYGEYNWANGSNWSRYFSAAQRHLWEWNIGKDNDEETSFNHLSHALANISFLLAYQLRELGKDDRQKVEGV